MHTAARWGRVDIAKYLADKGADINLKDSDEVILIIRITVDYSSNLTPKKRHNLCTMLTLACTYCCPEASQ